MAFVNSLRLVLPLIPAATVLMPPFVSAIPTDKRDGGDCPSRLVTDAFTIAVAPNSLTPGWIDSRFVAIADVNVPDNAQAILSSNDTLKTRYQINQKQGTIAAYMDDCADKLYYLNIVDEGAGNGVKQLQWNTQKLKNIWSIDKSGNFPIVAATGSQTFMGCLNPSGQDPTLYM